MQRQKNPRNIRALKRLLKLTTLRGVQTETEIHWDAEVILRSSTVNIQAKQALQATRHLKGGELDDEVFDLPAVHTRWRKRNTVRRFSAAQV